jgi:hypothetical protein
MHAVQNGHVGSNESKRMFYAHAGKGTMRIALWRPLPLKSMENNQTQKGTTSNGYGA